MCVYLTCLSEEDVHTETAWLPYMMSHAHAYLVPSHPPIPPLFPSFVFSSLFARYSSLLYSLLTLSLNPLPLTALYCQLTNKNTLFLLYSFTLTFTQPPTGLYPTRSLHIGTLTHTFPFSLESSLSLHSFSTHIP